MQSSKDSFSFQFDPFFTLHWRVGEKLTADDHEILEYGGGVPKEGEVSFAMEGTTNGWVSLGFTEVPGRMSPSDSIIGWLDDGLLEVSPYRIKVWRGLLSLVACVPQNFG